MGSENCSCATTMFDVATVSARDLVLIEAQQNDLVSFTAQRMRMLADVVARPSVDSGGGEKQW